MNNSVPYWLDKCGHQPFAEIGREDLIFGVLKGGSDSVFVSTPHLEGEYRNDGVELDAISDDAQDSTANNQAIIGTSSVNQSLPSLKVKTTYISDTDRLSLPQEFQIRGLKEADREGVFLNLRKGFVPLTNDTTLIRKLQNYSTTAGVTLPPCFRPTDILVANVLKGTLTFQEADDIWRVWENRDKQWVSKADQTFSDYYPSVDKELLREYFAIE